MSVFSCQPDDVGQNSNTESDSILDHSGSLNELVSDILDESNKSSCNNQQFNSWPVLSTIVPNQPSQDKMTYTEFWMSNPDTTITAAPGVGLHSSNSDGSASSNGNQWPFNPLSGVNLSTSTVKGDSLVVRGQAQSFGPSLQPETSSYADVTRGAPKMNTVLNSQPLPTSLVQGKISDQSASIGCTFDSQDGTLMSRRQSEVTRENLSNIPARNQMISREHLEVLRRKKLEQQVAALNLLKQNGKVFSQQSFSGMRGSLNQWHDFGNLSRFGKLNQLSQTIQKNEATNLRRNGTGNCYIPFHHIPPSMSPVPAAYKDFPNNRHLTHQQDGLSSQGQYTYEKHSSSAPSRPIPIPGTQVMQYGDNASVGSLEHFIYLNHVELQNLERERRKSEADLSKLFPGQRISSSNSIPSFQLPECPTKVDLLICDVDKEYHKVSTLSSKIGGLGKEGLHPDVEKTLDKWLEAIQRVTGHRKAEIAHSYRKLSPESVRQLYSPENSLITKLENLVECTRMARTSLWLATLFITHQVAYQANQ